MDESNLRVTKMYCLRVCGKILASGSQSEPICGYKKSISIFTEMWQHICHWPPNINCHSKSVLTSG